MKPAAPRQVREAANVWSWPGKVVTKVSEAGPFWEAEAEDQEYLRHYPESTNQFSR